MDIVVLARNIIVVARLIVEIVDLAALIFREKEMPPPS